jgi:uncharacterized protein YndB with AHSA1/START domain
MKVSDEPVVVEQTFNSSIESVWNSITDIELMRQWYFDNIPAFKPVVGYQTQFNVQSNERNFLHKWIVTEVQHLKLIKYSWEFENYPGKSTSAFELFQHDNQTKLKLTIEIQENFPEEIPEFRKESCIAGWEYFINNKLKDFLKGSKI